MNKKTLVVKPRVSDSEFSTFLSKLLDVEIIYAEPKKLHGTKFKSMYDSEDADMVICKSRTELTSLKSLGKITGMYKVVKNDDDIKDIAVLSETGADFIIVDSLDWKIIPLENIIAKVHGSETKIYTTAKNSEEVRTMFGVLELGVDGVILETNNEQEVSDSINYMESKILPIQEIDIIDLMDVGIGERVCVDTTSILNKGEGMLVGSRSNFLFLVHNESIGSSFTSPRPFRVNAGAIHCYTLTPDGKTKYLSELEAGAEILTVNSGGVSRRVTVGRSKIETRPLKMIKGETGGEVGTVILQNAETIRLVKSTGAIVSVTELKIGDKILGSAKQGSGRHFGMEVDEYLVEK
ncbi:MAG TPA: 3-dehydroquinate synthase II [Nitrososphaeraceae archaeon]|jgi:3-dehydroquinate synthase II